MLVKIKALKIFEDSGLRRKMKFTKKYTEYWRKTLGASVDGLKIAAPDAGVSLGEFSCTHSKIIQEIARISGFGSLTELVSEKR